MSIAPGSYTLGPEQATLTVRTRKGGAASKAGHDLQIEVERWTATLVVADDPGASSLELTADARSLRVVDGSGGIQSLGDDDKRGIAQTIDEEALRGTAIAFRSTQVTPSANGGPLTLAGELELAGRRAALSFELQVADDGRISAGATVRQSDWGMKPYSALFGTLKVLDEVQVEVDGALPTA